MENPHQTSLTSLWPRRLHCLLQKNTFFWSRAILLWFGWLWVQNGMWKASELNKTFCSNGLSALGELQESGDVAEKCCFLVKRVPYYIAL